MDLCVHSSVSHISINNKCNFTFYDPFHPRNILQTQHMECKSKLDFYTTDSVNIYWEVITWLTGIFNWLPAGNWRLETYSALISIRNCGWKFTWKQWLACWKHMVHPSWFASSTYWVVITRDGQKIGAGSQDIVFRIWINTRNTVKNKSPTFLDTTRTS